MLPCIAVRRDNRSNLLLHPLYIQGAVDIKCHIHAVKDTVVSNAIIAHIPYGVGEKHPRDHIFRITLFVPSLCLRAIILTSLNSLFYLILAIKPYLFIYWRISQNNPAKRKRIVRTRWKEIIFIFHGCSIPCLSLLCTRVRKPPSKLC